METEGTGKQTVLFVCVENAGRSQMAQAFATIHGLKSMSAGTVPSERINSTVVRAMREVGVDMGNMRPKMLTQEMIEGATHVVTMGCSLEDVCPRPLIAGLKKKSIDWHIEDPKGKSIEAVRAIRDEIERMVRELAGELSTARDSG